MKSGAEETEDSCPAWWLRSKEGQAIKEDGKRVMAWPPSAAEKGRRPPPRRLHDNRNGFETS